MKQVYVAVSPIALEEVVTIPFKGRFRVGHWGTVVVKSEALKMVHCVQNSVYIIICNRKYHAVESLDVVCH